MKYRVELARTHAPDCAEIVVEAADRNAAVKLALKIARSGAAIEWSPGEEVNEVWANDISEEKLS